MISKLKMRILRLLPKKLAHELYYKEKMHKKLNLACPCDINEKLQWLMVYRYDKAESVYADKLAVRSYVKDCGYEDTLTKLYGVYCSADEIELDTLPERFVLKTTHAAGKRYYSICTNKTEYDFNAERKKLASACRVNYANVAFEYHYGYIKPHIIAEEFIDSGEDTLRDYKLFCFSGKVECILVCSDRESALKRDYFDRDWNKLYYTKPEYQSSDVIPCPNKLKQMIKMAETLSKPFCFARIDLYCAQGKVYFGEITLTPAAGTNRTYTDAAAKHLGDLIDLDKENEHV